MDRQSSKSTAPAAPGFLTRSNIMTTYTFQRATYNGTNGWFATRRIDGVYAGKQFGRTRAAAQASFDV